MLLISPHGSLQIRSKGKLPRPHDKRASEQKFRACLVTQSGWTNSELFPLVLENFIRHMDISVAKPGVLVMDNHKIHCASTVLHTDFNMGQASTLGAIAESKAEIKVNPGYI